MRVRTSEHVKDAEFTVQVDGKLVDAKISKQYGDLRSFDLTLGAELSNGQNVEVQAKGGTMMQAMLSQRSRCITVHWDTMKWHLWRANKIIETGSQKWGPVFL